MAAACLTTACTSATVAQRQIADGTPAASMFQVSVPCVTDDHTRAALSPFFRGLSSFGSQVAPVRTAS